MGQRATRPVYASAGRQRTPGRLPFKWHRKSQRLTPTYEGSLDKLFFDVAVQTEPPIGRPRASTQSDSQFEATDQGDVPIRHTYSKTAEKAQRCQDKDGRLFDEIIELLERDVAESARTSRYLQHCMLADIKATEKAVAELPWPASHSLVVPDAFGECAVNAPSSVRGRLDGGHSGYTQDSDSEAASLREFEELEKSCELMEKACRVQRQNVEKPVVRVRRVRAASRLRSPSDCSSNKAKEESAAPSQDNKLWIECPAENLKVFNNPEDRRIASIARVSGCRIKLTETRRKSALGQWQQLVLIQPTTETGLQKCMNLLDEKFPEFRTGFKPRYSK
ncbi:unnamed protein product [Dibothriocephalus latus]|uniref:Uncharacterized protein n=1 Tax=Dibothriocephalus latus TaxID=60516 RepID=A0A3P6RPS5_DIBLA|nr:unnamed protein product [Dibothriocephalus latus]